MKFNINTQTIILIQIFIAILILALLFDIKLFGLNKIKRENFNQKFDITTPEGVIGLIKYNSSELNKLQNKINDTISNDTNKIQEYETKINNMENTLKVLTAKKLLNTKNNIIYSLYNDYSDM